VKCNLNALSNVPKDVLSKNTGLFGGIADIHDFHQGTPFYFNRLGKNQACNDR
jgi:hypothetical protein